MRRELKELVPYFTCKALEAHDTLVNSLRSFTLLRLISSTLLHFGKASELALHSASTTPGMASRLALRSLCATVITLFFKVKVKVDLVDSEIDFAGKGKTFPPLRNGLGWT